MIAAASVVADPAVRLELAEDLTARALDRCVPLLDRGGVPEHIRAWTSAPVLAVEADLTARLADRAAGPTAGAPDADLTSPPSDLTPLVEAATAAGRLDAGQAAAVAALAGDRALIVVEGAAGAGKTTTLAAARDLGRPPVGRGAGEAWPLEGGAGTRARLTKVLTLRELWTPRACRPILHP